LIGVLRFLLLAHFVSRLPFDEVSLGIAVPDLAVLIGLTFLMPS
jgi:hypothetical protein